jgi:hypothetical protein
MNGKKQRQLSGKGHNELLEIVNPLVQRESQLIPVKATRLKIVARGEARAARDSGFCALQKRASLQQIRHKNQYPRNFLSLQGFNVVTCEQMKCKQMWCSGMISFERSQ